MSDGLAILQEQLEERRQRRRQLLMEHQQRLIENQQLSQGSDAFQRRHSQFIDDGRSLQEQLEERRERRRQLLMEHQQQFGVKGQAINSEQPNQPYISPPPQKQKEPGILGQMGNAFIQGAANLGQNFFTTLSVFSEKLTPNSDFTRIMKNAQKGYQEILEEHPEWDAPEGTAWNSPVGIARAISGTVPFMLVSNIFEVAGNYFFPGVGAVATATVTFPVEFGDTYNEAISMGASKEQAEKAARIAGGINAFIEALPLEQLTMGKSEVVEQIIKKKIRNKVAKYAAKVGMAIFPTAVSEGTEEALQQITSNLSAKHFYDEHRQWSDTVVESFTLGAITGGVLSGGASIAENFFAKRNKAINQAQEAGISKDKAASFFDEIVEEATSDKKIDEIVEQRDKQEKQDDPTVKQEEVGEIKPEIVENKQEEIKPEKIKNDKKEVSKKPDKPKYNLDIKPNPNLDAREKKVETTAIKQFKKNPGKMIDDYINRVENNGGVLSVDDASELINVYRKNKSENRIATNVVASKLVEQTFNHKLDNLDANKDNVAVFTAGGPASFKSSSVNAFIRTNKLNPQFIFDSNLANFDTAVSLIDKTLNKGLGVRIIYSYRNVIDAWKSNLERAGKHERVVALNTFIRNHLDAPETLIKLQEKYQDNPNIKFELFNQNIKNGDKSISFDKLRSLLYDNNNGKISRLDTGKGQTLSRSISESVRDGGERISRAQKETSLREQAKAIAKAGYQSGAISEQVYRGALRGYLDEQKPTASKTAKKSPTKSPTKTKKAEKVKSSTKDKNSKIKSKEKTPTTAKVSSKATKNKTESKTSKAESNTSNNSKDAIAPKTNGKGSKNTTTTKAKKQDKNKQITKEQINKDKSTKAKSQKQEQKLTAEKLIGKVSEFTSPDVFAKVYKGQGFTRPQLIELYQKEKARLRNRSNNQKLKEEKAKNQKVISQTDEEVATKFALAQQASRNEIELAKIDLDEVYKEYQKSGGDYSKGDYVINNKTEKINTIWKTPELLRLAKKLGTDVNVKTYMGQAMGVFYAHKALTDQAAIGLSQNIIKDPKLTSYVLAHEIGHFVDYLPSGYIKRSNILRKALVIKEGMKVPVIKGLNNAKLKEQVIKVVNLRKGIKSAADLKKSNSKFASYLYSAKELYAEWFSTLLTQPEIVEKHSPDMMKLWLENLGKKPAVNATYLSMVNEIISGNYLKIRSDNIRMDAVQAEQRRLATIAIAKEQRKDFFVGAACHLLRQDSAVRRDYKKALKRYGDTVANPIYNLEEHGYLSTTVNEYRDKYITTLSKFVNENKLDINTLHEMAFLERIINERGAVENPAQVALDRMGTENWEPIEESLQKNGIEIFTLSAGEQYRAFKNNLSEQQYEQVMSNLPKKGGIANPYGFDAETAKESLEYLESTNQQDWDKYKEALGILREFNKSVIELAEKGEFYTKETLEMMKKNDSYVTFQVIDYMGSKMTAALKSQKGTLKGIGNTIFSTIEKNLAIIHAVETNKVKNELVDWYKNYLPEEISLAETKKEGRRTVFVEPINKDKYGLIKVYEKGELKAYVVDRYVADVFNKVQREGFLRETLRIMDFVNWLPRKLMIGLNMGFQISNFGRDFGRYSRNNPFTDALDPLKLPKQIKYYRKAIPKAIAIIKNQTDASIQEIKDAKILIEDSIFGIEKDISSISTDEEKMRQAMMNRFGLENKKEVASAFQLFGKADDILSTSGKFIEMLPKIAGYLEYQDYKKRMGDKAKFSDREAYSIIRNRLGSPNYNNKARYNKELASIFLFYNAIKEGQISDIQAITDKKTRANTLLNIAVGLIPKLAMIAVAKGLFGDELKKLMDSISNYDKTNYFVIPFGRDDKDRAMYLRLPINDSDRLLGAIFWQALGKEGGNVTDKVQTVIESLTEPFPNLSPAFKVGSNILDYATGKNIWDSWYQSKVFTDEEMAIGGVNKFWKLFLYGMQNLGGSIAMPKFREDDEERSSVQKLVEAPATYGILGRFLRYSNKGDREILREIQKQGEREQIIKTANEKKLVEAHFKKYQDELAKLSGEEKEERVAELSRELVADTLKIDKDYDSDDLSKEEQQTAKRISDKFARASVDKKYKTILERVYATNNKETKIKLLLEVTKRMSASEIEKLLDEGERTKLISGSFSNDVKDILGLGEGNDK